MNTRHETERIERLVYTDPESRVKLTAEVLERDTLLKPSVSDHMIQSRFYDPENAEEMVITLKMNLFNNSLAMQMNKDEANTFFSDLIKTLVRYDLISAQDLTKITQDEYL